MDCGRVPGCSVIRGQQLQPRGALLLVSDIHARSSQTLAGEINISYIPLWKLLYLLVFCWARPKLTASELQLVFAKRSCFCLPREDSDSVCLPAGFDGGIYISVVFFLTGNIFREDFSAKTCNAKYADFINSFILPWDNIFNAECWFVCARTALARVCVQCSRHWWREIHTAPKVLQ